MPIQLQTAEIADRLRRFFLLRGRVRGQLDETIVPVAQVVDVTGAPYSRDPLSGWHLGAMGAIAGEFSLVGLLPQGADKLLIKQLWLVNPSAGAIFFEVYQGTTTPANNLNLRAISAVNLPRAASASFPLCTTNGFDGSNAGLPGTTRRIAGFQVPAASNYGPITFRDWVVSTDDVAFITASAVNTAVQAVWNFDEYNTPIV